MTADQGSTPLPFLVKICGLTRPDDWKVCVEAGADLIGLVFFARSPRAIAPRQASTLARACGWTARPPEAATLASLAGLRARRGEPARVGVFVDPLAEEIEEAVEAAALDAIQLHGEAPEEGYAVAAKLGLLVLRAIAVGGPLREGDFATSHGQPVAHLCDTRKEGLHGGTGELFDHALLRPWVAAHPVFLAGGLDPDNIADIAAGLGALVGCDVSSGVESAPGVKDHAKIRRFIEQARLGRARAGSA